MKGCAPLYIHSVECSCVKTKQVLNNVDRIVMLACHVQGQYTAIVWIVERKNCLLPAETILAHLSPPSINIASLCLLSIVQMNRLHIRQAWDCKAKPGAGVLEHDIDVVH